MPLYQLHRRPHLDTPVLVMPFEGFIDSGGAGGGAMQAIHSTSANHTPAGDPVSTDAVAVFDSEALLDFRARRPIMHLVNGINTSLSWPLIQLFVRRDRNGRELLVLTGPEPDHLWPSFAREVVDLAIELKVRQVVNLGAYPAATPHTRPPHLTATTTSVDVQHQFGFLQATLDVPAGIHAVIEHESAARGLTAVSLWAQVPHYAASMPYPACAIALLEGMHRLTQLEFDIDELAQQAATVQLHLAEVISRNEEHQQMLRQLEVQDDVLRQSQSAELPSGDEIAAEVEKYLREQND